MKMPVEGIKTYNDYIGETIRKNEDLINSITGVGDVMYGLGSIMGENAGAWMQWGANLLTVIGQSLPAIMALTSANTAAAAAGGAAAVASTPVVGPILAVAAVASILGALVSIPKFEAGGIVPGGSYSGDKVLARVNSGELILNTAQQRNLAGALNFGGNVRFEIEGNKLVGILEQDTKKRSRR